jgi:biotin carboxyl carrier protein
MKFEINVRAGGVERSRTVQLERDGERWRAILDGVRVDADAVEIAPNLISVLIRGESHEIRVMPAADGTLTLQNGIAEFAAEIIDPREWGGRKHGSIVAEGRQQIAAPMPGKIVRVLVKPGDEVEAGQGLIVVEAMKMQNEIKSPKKGKVERVLAEAGQTVNAGQVLAWID